MAAIVGGVVEQRRARETDPVEDDHTEQDREQRSGQVRARGRARTPAAGGWIVPMFIGMACGSLLPCGGIIAAFSAGAHSAAVG